MYVGLVLELEIPLPPTAVKNTNESNKKMQLQWTAAELQLTRHAVKPRLPSSHLQTQTKFKPIQLHFGAQHGTTHSEMHTISLKISGLLKFLVDLMCRTGVGTSPLWIRSRKPFTCEGTRAACTPMGKALQTCEFCFPRTSENGFGPAAAVVYRTHRQYLVMNHSQLPIHRRRCQQFTITANYAICPSGHLICE